MCCAATDRTACESGQVKNTEIQQRLPWFRTLGMTLSRGKSPQTAKHPFWNIMLVLVHHRPVRPSVRPSVRSSPFSATIFISNNILSRPRAIIFSDRLINDHDRSSRASQRRRSFKFNTLFAWLVLCLSISLLLFFFLSTCLAIPTYSRIFTPASSFLFGTCQYVTIYRFMGLRFIDVMFIYRRDKHFAFSLFLFD